MGEEDPLEIKILVASDIHLGYAERDTIRKRDSIDSFEEVLKIADEKKVDMLLLGKVSSFLDGRIFRHLDDCFLIPPNLLGQAFLGGPLCCWAGAVYADVGFAGQKEPFVCISLYARQNF